MNCGQNSEILSLHFGDNVKLGTQHAILANYLKIIDFSDWNV